MRNKAKMIISDLDGTLLCSDERVSGYTADVINRFIQNGGCFSYATARSISSSSKVTDGIHMKFPVICSDGTFIVNPATHEICLGNFFTSKEIGTVREALVEQSASPIVFACIDDKVRFSFIEKLLTHATKKFVDDRTGDPRIREVDSISDLYSGDIYRVVWTPLSPDKISEEEYRFSEFSRRDYHPQYNLCDILSVRATKANAALQLKAMVGCEMIIAFGDDWNDIPLFSIADEKYAMADAIPELKEIATDVIDSNDNDGVARWIEEHLL